MKPECYVYTNDRDTHGPVCKWCQPKVLLEEGWRYEPVFGDECRHDSCDQCRDPIHEPTNTTDRLFEEVLELSRGEYHEEFDNGNHPVYRWLLDYCASSYHTESEWPTTEKAECFRSLAQAMWESPRKFHA